MNTGEFIRRVRRHARTRGLEFAYDPRKGKGSHGRVYLGERFTTVKASHKPIAKGLLHSMLRDLGISLEDF